MIGNVASTVNLVLLLQDLCLSGKKLKFLHPIHFLVIFCWQYVIHCLLFMNDFNSVRTSYKHSSKDLIYS